jgi:hypothetical protein
VRFVGRPHREAAAAISPVQASIFLARTFGLPCTLREGCDEHNRLSPLRSRPVPASSGTPCLRRPSRAGRNQCTGTLALSAAESVMNTKACSGSPRLQPRSPGRRYVPLRTRGRAPRRAARGRGAGLQRKFGPLGVGTTKMQRDGGRRRHTTNVDK